MRTYYARRRPESAFGSVLFGFMAGFTFGFLRDIFKTPRQNRW